MNSRSVEIATEFSIDGSGILLDVYIGDASEPVLCEYTSFRELVENYIDSFLNTEGKLDSSSYSGIQDLLDNTEEFFTFAKYVAAEKGFYGEEK